MTYFTWYGTNSIKLTYNDKSILIDPFIRYNKKNDKDFINNFYDIKNIFITHGHIDHTLDLPYLYKNKDVKIHGTNCVYKRLNKLINKDKLIKIKHNDNFKYDVFNITVLKSKHIKFDIKLGINTLFNKRIIKYFKNFCYLSYNHFKCKENNETVAFYILVNNIKILVLGSLNLDKDTTYPTNVDYLILAYQGNSYLEKKALPIINKIKPKNIILSHFDDSFPPISTNVDTSKLRNYINKKINIIIPNHDERIELK